MFSPTFHGPCFCRDLTATTALGLACGRTWKANNTPLTRRVPRAGLVVKIKGDASQDDQEPFFCSLHTYILPKDDRMSNFNESQFLPSLSGWIAARVLRDTMDCRVTLFLAMTESVLSSRAFSPLPLVIARA
jgi:hypothetical protein